MGVLYTTDKLNNEDYSYIISHIAEISSVLLYVEDGSNADEPISEMLHIPLKIKNGFSDINSYANENDFERIITPCDYLAALMLQTKNQVTFLCRGLLKMGDGAPLEKLVMENYIIKNI